MTFKPFSKKQRLSMRWWLTDEHSQKDAVICDGAIRSGKTLCMSIGFIAWATACFNNQSFALAGKTITSVIRNVVTPLIPVLTNAGFSVKEYKSKNMFTVSFCGRTNRFYAFGGKDESSASLIQGMTLGGIFLDEVVLMPRSFTQQAIARCSLNGSKLWFNCNPDHPCHWFYREWILKAEQKNALYIHFDLCDNPSLSQKVLSRYKRLYSGVFYERFILGKWTAAFGLVYPMFSTDKHTFDTPPESFSRYAVSCDYGTVNPSSFGLWGFNDGVWYRLREYYYSSKRENAQRTDEEHYQGLVSLIDGLDVEGVVCDPSAASFMECIRRHGEYKVIPAKNDVLYGIRKVGTLLSQNRLRFSKSCADTLREFSLYRWSEKSAGDIPIKENDHSMDDIRYFVTAIADRKEDDFFVMSLSRK